MINPSCESHELCQNKWQPTRLTTHSRGGNAEKEGLATKTINRTRTRYRTRNFQISTGCCSSVNSHPSASFASTLPDSSWWQGSESTKWVFLLNVVCHILLLRAGFPSTHPRCGVTQHDAAGMISWDMTEQHCCSFWSKHLLLAVISSAGSGFPKHLTWLLLHCTLLFLYL